MAVTQRYIDDETGKRLSRRALSYLRAERVEAREAIPRNPGNRFGSGNLLTPEQDRARSERITARAKLSAKTRFRRAGYVVPPDNQSRVYLMRRLNSDGSVDFKIGQSICVPFRWASLKAEYKTLEYIGAIVEDGVVSEASLLEAMSRYCIGGEWFSDAPDLQNLARAMSRGDDAHSEVANMIHGSPHDFASGESREMYREAQYRQAQLDKAARSAK